MKNQHTQIQSLFRKITSVNTPALLKAANLLTTLGWILQVHENKYKKKVVYKMLVSAC